MSEKKQQSFGKYTLLDRVAVGGMAEIFLAKQSGVEGFEKLIALKRMRPHFSGDQNFVRMFLNEAKLAAQLSHQNIVQIYDLGKIAESYFIAMEYVSGRDMSRVLPKCHALNIEFPLVYALKIASATLEALYYAHNKADATGQPLHIVHRDVTPENILVSFAGSVKIADFGIAKATMQLGGGEGALTRVGEIKGKLAYMSPEQCMGKELDHRSDVFSLGVVLYEWITGFKLFSGDNDLAVMNNIIEGKIYPPSYFRDGIPDAVETILMKALEKDRKKRYQSAWDMQFDIDTFLSSNDFTPSNVHLANFMKQLFRDEIDKEQTFLAQIATPKKSEPEASKKAADVIELSAETPFIATHEIVIDPPVQPPENRGDIVTLRLKRQSLERLQRLAQKKGQAIELIAAAMLDSMLTPRSDN